MRRMGNITALAAVALGFAPTAVNAFICLALTAVLASETGTLGVRSTPIAEGFSDRLNLRVLATILLLFRKAILTQREEIKLRKLAEDAARESAEEARQQALEARARLAATARRRFSWDRVAESVLSGARGRLDELDQHAAALELDDEQHPSTGMPGEDIDDPALAVDRERDLGLELPPIQTGQERRHRLLRLDGHAFGSNHENLGRLSDFGRAPREQLAYPESLPQ